MNFLPIFLAILSVITYLVVMNKLNKKQFKPSARLTYLNEDSVKVTLYRNNVFSLGYHPFDLYWKKMVDRNTGQFQFFNNNSNYITNCEAQEEIEKHLINGRVVI